MKKISNRLTIINLVITENLKYHSTLCKIGMQIFSLGKEAELQ